MLFNHGIVTLILSHCYVNNINYQ